MNAQVAQHLNLAESLIKSVEEWANVLFVRFFSGRPRFVSKKAIAVRTISTKKKTSASGMVEWKAGMKFKEDGAIWVVTKAENTRIYWDGGVCDEIAEWAIAADFVRAA